MDWTDDVVRVRVPATSANLGPGFDALALALRVDCPIFVEETVLQSSKISSAISAQTTSEELRKWLEGLSDEDLGRYKM